jgi:hypothetical protein
MTEQNLIFAHEAAIVDMQCLLNKAIKDAGLTRKEFEKIVGKRFSRSLFADDCVASLGSFAVAFAALGKQLNFSLEGLENDDRYSGISYD